MIQYNSQGINRDKALSITGISKHQYYYRSKGTKQGLKPSLYTLTALGESINNSEIVNIIKEIHTNPDTQYGYIKMTYALKTKGCRTIVSCGKSSSTRSFFHPLG